MSEKRSPKDWVKIILIRAAKLLVPILIFVALFGFFWFVFPPPGGSASSFSPEYLVFIGLMIAYIVPPFGKETIIPIALIGGEGLTNLVGNFISISADSALGGYPLWTVSAGIIIIDILVSSFITLNFDLLLKIPLIGKWLSWIMRGAEKVMKKRKWIEDLASAGLLIFMYLPFQGSGAMTTSVIARFLNYRPAQAIGLVGLGSILSVLTVSLGITSIVELWKVNPVLAILEGVAIVAVIALIAFFWNKIVHKMTEKKKQLDAKKEKTVQ